MKIVTELPLRETFSDIKTALVLNGDEKMRRLLSDVVRQSLGLRVLEAGSVAEARYLIAVEGKISLLLSDSLSKDHRDFAQRLLAINPALMVVVAKDSLWELIGGPDGRGEQVLILKSYTVKELVSTLNWLLDSPKPKPSERASRSFDMEPLGSPVSP